MRSLLTLLVGACPACSNCLGVTLCGSSVRESLRWHSGVRDRSCPPAACARDDPSEPLKFGAAWSPPAIDDVVVSEEKIVEAARAWGLIYNYGTGNEGDPIAYQHGA